MESRTHVFIVLAILALAFWLLWFLLGGETVKTHQPVLVSSSDEDLLLEETSHRGRRGASTSFSLSPDAGDTSSSSSSQSFSFVDAETIAEEEVVDEKALLFGLNPRFLDRIRTPVRPTLEQRKARLREELQAQGFTNEAYINMMVLELEDEKIDPAREQAEEYLKRGNPAMALRVLKDALQSTDPRNLLVRANLYASIGMVAGKYAFPDELLESTSHLLDLQSQILEVKRATPQLMSNPETREQLDAQYDMVVNQRANMMDQTKGAIAMLTEHQGLHPEAIKMRNAMYLNVERASGSPFANGELSKVSASLDEETKAAWSKPQFLR